MEIKINGNPIKMETRTIENTRSPNYYKKWIVKIDPNISLILFSHGGWMSYVIRDGVTKRAICLSFDALARHYLH